MSQFMINMLLWVGPSALHRYCVSGPRRPTKGSTLRVVVFPHCQWYGNRCGLDVSCIIYFNSVIIAATGYASSAYLMGWTGGYVILAMLLAPYLRKFGKFTVPDFIGERFCINCA